MNTDQVTTLASSSQSYRLGPLHRRGSVANLYTATTADGAQVMLKLPRKPRSNMLIEAEQAALRDLAELAAAETWLPPYLTRLTDTLTHHDDATGAARRVSVLAPLLDGFVTLADVAAAYPDGLDPRDYAWMHRRLLRALAAVHAAGWVHGALTPANILIHPAAHGVVLAGWSFATGAGQRLAARTSTDERLYPPEALAGEPVSGESDVYMVHALMDQLLGPAAPEPLRRFSRGCRQRSPRRRPDAAALIGEFDDLLDRLYGKRRFRPFELPQKGR
ncbi:protein kinase family protein [Mycobacterium talmoniae]|uniref:Protein kinase domain-containing protein n=1 Tax=Mycobacterium talmoniae TaxID=1858794 RepID=A0A1S1NMA1_9MYCO|nr:protein kinase family protein [Mycobacterium talmoniae]OHV05325.1 hypothetical protein BKN37_06150 [Mycobacterium talmoniae]